MDNQLSQTKQQKNTPEIYTNYINNGNKNVDWTKLKWTLQNI